MLETFRFLTITPIYKKVSIYVNPLYEKVSQMTLQEYLERFNLTRLQFAQKADISRAALYRYLEGKKPTASIALKIHAATKGKVTLKDMGF